MKAGLRSVSPLELEDQSGDKEEDVLNTEDCDRIAAEEDDGVVKRILDPRLPSREEVERHYGSGHLPYRN